MVHLSGLFVQLCETGNPSENEECQLSIVMEFHDLYYVLGMQFRFMKFEWQTRLLERSCLLHEVVPEPSEGCLNQL